MIGPADAAREMEPARQPDTPLALVFMLLLLAMALAVPGLYLWLPLLGALIVTRNWGFRPGLAALVLLSLPLIWRDGIWHPVLALGALLSANVARRWGFMAAEAIALYGVLVTALLALFHGIVEPNSSWLLAVPAFRDLMRAVLLAAIADILNVNFLLVRRWPFAIFDPRRSLFRNIRAGSNPLIIIFIAIPAINQLFALYGLEAGYRSQVNAAALSRVAPLVEAGQQAGTGRFRLPAQPRDTSFYFRLSSSTLPADLADRLDASCRTSTAPVSAKGEFAPCGDVHVLVAGKPVDITLVYREFDSGLIPRRYDQLLMLLAGALLALFYRKTLSRTLRDTFAQTDLLIGQFGKHELTGLPYPPISEMEGPIYRLVELNNANVAVRLERERLAEVAADLSRSIGLNLMREVRFEAETGALSYVEVRMIGDAVQSTLQVHPDDWDQFMSAAGRAEAVIEFRLAAANELECMLVTLHDSRGGMHWTSGVMVQLNRPRHFDAVIAKQARLADLGNAASSIGHEIKQPLFTIAVAAESLRLLATKAQSGLNDPQILGRIDRISEQVGRARDIIEHISLYGKPAQGVPSMIDVAEIMRRAYGFLESALEDQRIDVVLSIRDGALRTVISQVELEQVFVNAIQNAADSLAARRAGGWPGAARIELLIESSPTTIRCAIIDNGMGFGPKIAESAFTAFFTTKAEKGMGLGLYISRQIIERAGGTIELRPGDGGEGAVLEIELPAVKDERKRRGRDVRVTPRTASDAA